jgi:hypothetical protein
MPKKKSENTNPLSPNKMSRSMRKWLNSKLFKQDRLAVKSYVRDESNHIDIDANNPEFLSNIVEKVILMMNEEDDRYMYLQGLEERHDYLRYKELKRCVSKYLKKSSSPSKSGNSNENFSPETFGDQNE